VVGDPNGKAEHLGLSNLGDRFVENYVPIRSDTSGAPEVLAVIEIYRNPISLFEGIRDANGVCGWAWWRLG